MSGIAGMLRFDDRPVSRPGLERAANALRAHGPDRTGLTIEGRVGFVHVLMAMTPQDRQDRQPLRGTSGALMTADLRLDNRAELLARLGVLHADANAWPDARVVLAAWERFGDIVWPLLRGPFAVAIFDPRSGALTLVRDHLGLNVVMWHNCKSHFAFATMPNGLFALDAVRRELSEEKFADFLVLNHADHATTIYRDVYRVRPAHVLRVDAHGTICETRYWSPQDIPPIRLRSDDDYAEGLRATLDMAVRRQLRSAHPVGCLLSGGLDSSSVAAFAAGALAEKNQRLAAYTGVPRRGFAGPVPQGHYADETPFVDAIARMAGNIDVTYAQDEAAADLGELERIFFALEGPVRNPTNLGWALALLRLARADGRRVLLGGLRGNHTISWSGWSQALSHLRSGRFLTALRQWRLYYRRSPYSRWRAAYKMFVEPVLAAPNGSAAPWRTHSPIRPEFAAEMDVAARAKRHGHDFSYRARGDERFQGLLLADYAGDWHAAEKALTGVEVRDPTADIDVVSYCFGVPAEQYLAEDIDRSLIRRAMWGLLPQSILTNRLHGLQSAGWCESLQDRREDIAREVAELSQSPLARRAIDLPRLDRAVANWPAGGWHRPEIFTEYNLMLMRGLAGGRFLRWFEQAN